MSQLGQAEGELNFPVLFCSLQSLSGLGDAHPSWKEQSSFQTQQYKQDEETEEYPAGKGTE